MLKYLFFIVGGTAAIYISIYGSKSVFKFITIPTKADLQFAYDNIKLKKENALLRNQLTKSEFALSRAKEIMPAEYDSYIARGIASKDETFVLIGKNKTNTDHVQQAIYKWSPLKLYALTTKEYELKNYIPSAQFGMTLLNEMNKNSKISVPEITENFYLNLGIACFQSKIYLKESQQVLRLMISKYPNSPLIVRAKLWLALSYHKTKDNVAFESIMLEFKRKYQNTKEWQLLNNMHERNVASEKDK